MNMDLSSLARTLAERLMKQMEDNCLDYREHVATAEAVIREAIEKTLAIAASTVGTAKSSHGCDDFIIRHDAEEAIRSLKQSNSGKERVNG